VKGDESWTASMVGLKRKISRALRLGDGPSALELDAALTEGDRSEKLAVLRRITQESQRVPAGAEPDGRFSTLLTALTAERDAHVLSYLVRVAGHLGGVATVRVLSPLLGHADARVVSNTLETLAQTGDETVFTLAVPLIARPEPRVRATALAVLCRFDRTAAIDAMVNFLKNAKDPAQKQGALFAIRAVGGLPAEVLRSLESEVDDPEVREALARILEEATPAGLPRLLVRTQHGVQKAIAKRFGRKRPRGLQLALPMAGALAVASIGLMTALMLRAPLPAEGPAPAVRPGAPLTAAALAVAPAGTHEGTRVSWDGTVREVRSGSAVVAVPGGEVLVRLDEASALNPGDRIAVTGVLAGRSGLGMPYLEARTVRVVTPAPPPRNQPPMDRGLARLRF
jgi:hypothetical protein